jgi:hypothetical protein
MGWIDEKRKTLDRRPYSYSKRFVVWHFETVAWSIPKHSAIIVSIDSFSFLVVVVVAAAARILDRPSLFHSADGEQVVSTISCAV